MLEVPGGRSNKDGGALAPNRQTPLFPLSPQAQLAPRSHFFRATSCCRPWPWAVDPTSVGRRVQHPAQGCHGRISAAARGPCLCEDRVYRQRIVPRASVDRRQRVCAERRRARPSMPSTKPSFKRSDVAFTSPPRPPRPVLASVWSGSRVWPRPRWTESSST
jgi:hypothetical protein